MRRPFALALLALTIPATTLVAQRRMIPVLLGRGKTPERPADKPPQAPGIHDARLYNRYKLSRFSVEQSPMVSYFRANGVIAEGIPSNNVSFGDVTHFSFRATPSLFVSADLTSSFLNGPFAMGTAEFGFRVKPWTAPRVAPFVDARVNYAYTMSSSNSGVSSVFLARPSGSDFTTGSGHGKLLALGAESRLSARFFLTTAISQTRYAMRGRSMSTLQEWNYAIDATRFTVGFRYNGGRWLDAP